MISEMGFVTFIILMADMTINAFTLFATARR